MGNVHSLRGEQDEAMRYYAEVTGLRATKSTLQDNASATDTRSLFSGLNNGEDNSTLMSEINEDVKALDDLFRSISFRTGEGANGMEKRKSTPLSPNSDSRSSNKRRKGDSVPGSDALENEPFKRSTSICSVNTPGTKTDLGESLEMFRTVLDTYTGPNIEQHKETCNSFSLRADLLVENRKQTASSPTNRKETQQSDASELELAVEIYLQVLSIQKEMNERVQNDPNLSANTASTLIRLGSVYYKLGNRVDELQMYREAKAVYKNAFGENHTFVAGARKNIGMVLAERGEYEQAMQQFEKARKIYLAVNDNEEMNRDVASAVSCMGNVKNRVGDLDEALSHYMKALAIYKSIQDSSMETDASVNTMDLSNAMKDVTSTLKVIGMVHAKRGELDTAMGFFKEAMALLRTNGIDRTATGRETTASVLTRMASIHVKKNDLDQAMEHYREAYELTVRHRGSTNHQDVAGILHYIGGIHHKRGDYDEAMNCYQEAIRIYHTTLGPGNPTVAGTLVMVGSIHYKRRNLDSAMMFYREALRLNRDAYGLHHPDVAPILKSIGTIMTKKGEYGEAYDIFRDVLSIKCTVHGTGHPEVASAYKSLGNVHYKMGELADAERQYRHALSIYRRIKGDDHADTIAARTTIEHLRYWMKNRNPNNTEQRHARNSSRAKSDERSC
jgi:tetratricopeptide (TPR) repeat protein